ncbi:hypothetical protein BH10PSE7_BH10PSE7_39480 [soil metagenome]
MEYLMLWAVGGVVTAIVAMNRGRSFPAWLAIGLVIGFGGIFLVSMMPVIPRDRALARFDDAD